VTDDLRLEGVTVTFGGLVAVDNVSLLAPGCRITGLIGPNGAGKTTTFNAATGVVPLSSGSVRLGDTVLDGLSTTARAQRGLGRSFQRMELFDTMTVRENVEMGPELGMAGRRPWTHLASARRERIEVAERATEALVRCGIEHLADAPAADLSTGQRRLVELARALASRFRFLLLDEPSSGLDHGETAHVAQVLRDAVERDGNSILLVEHDMTLVRDVCEHVYVLDFGKLIYEGDTADALASDVVKAAYLGDRSLEAVVG
jgi:ABC-type branched-subunit amino acid transport system ATPase component